MLKMFIQILGITEGRKMQIINRIWYTAEIVCYLGDCLDGRLRVDPAVLMPAPVQSQLLRQRGDLSL